MKFTVNMIEAALRKPLPGIKAQLRMAPRPGSLKLPTPQSTPRKSGVLILLFPSEETGELCFVLTRRTEIVADHKGQISLPGGAVDPDDPSIAYTALREACEEVGVCSDVMRILGPLTPIYIPPSDFCVQPYVAYMSQSPQFFPQPEEVAEIIEVPIPHLLDEKNVVVEEWLLDDEVKQVPFFNIYGHKVWGATAVVLSEFAAILEDLLKE
ncbi:MAG: coenzyme pyrophosphatase [Deltaproteobacteria bacterium]|nr:coenzyme pyrophosphatase [Deltaproteobacteria bacterium]